MVVLNDTDQVWQGLLQESRATQRSHPCHHVDRGQRSAANVHSDRPPSPALPPEDPSAEIVVARLDTVTRVHTFVEDIELSLDRDPIDVEVLRAEDGYAVKVTARSFVRDVTLLADRAAADATVDDALVTLPAGQSTTFRVRSSNLEHVLGSPPVLRTANDLQHTPSVVQRR